MLYLYECKTRIECECECDYVYIIFVCVYGFVDLFTICLDSSVCCLLFVTNEITKLKSNLVKNKNKPSPLTQMNGMRSKGNAELLTTQKDYAIAPNIPQ